MFDAVGEGWVTTGQAAAVTGYSEGYLRRLADQGRVTAQKVGRDWLLLLEDVLAHREQMDALGDQRHDPWREDLAEQDRGRRR